MDRHIVAYNALEQVSNVCDRGATRRQSSLLGRPFVGGMGGGGDVYHSLVAD